jgi:hypothetical protein
LTKTLIDVSNGHFLFSNTFTMSNRTTPDNLILYFGKENVKISDMQNGWRHYIVSNVQNEKIYLSLTFYFENNTLSFLSFTIDDKPISTNFWDNWSKENEIQKRLYFDDWLTKQFGKKREFSWGTIGAFFDEKGGFSSIVLRYEPNLDKN